MQQHLVSLWLRRWLQGWVQLLWQLFRFAYKFGWHLPFLLMGLAVAGQAIIACAFAEKDYQKATAAASRVLQMAFVLGLGLSLVVGLGLQFGSVVFTQDKHVLHLITIGNIYTLNKDQ